MNIDANRLLAVAEEAATEAGALIFQKRKTAFKVSKKGKVNLVTEVDLAAEELIVSTVHRHFPEHQILAEERGSAEGTVPIKWVIDPIDGTTNYAHDYPFFCVSIGIEIEGALAAGVVHDPVSRETFTAVSGEGAYLNGKPIQVSSESSLVDSLLVTGFSYGTPEIQKNLRLFNEMMMEARSVRRDGSAALDLCYVACGRYEGFWELSLQPWDVAAGSLIVQEAGGMVTRFDQTNATIYDRECLATNGKVHQAISEILTRACNFPDDL
ncbi:MAG: inositol monophosphatase [Acidobacteriota bacterium]|nr:MAG: inositol monophosphatase [Acidobacteriota bacterium]